jgi:3-oxoacyl-(acyl-carrier-protein) synthase
MSRRAVITGLGVVAPNGIGTEAFWAATRSGISGIKPITRFDASKYSCRLAGQVDGFEATDYVDQRLIVQTDRWTWMGLAAAGMALKDAGFTTPGADPYKVGVVTSSSSGGNEFGQREIQSLWSRGPIFVGAYQSIAWFYAATTGQIAIRYGLKGPCGVVISEGAGGLDALAHSRRNIQRGVDAVVSGGTEAPLAPYVFACQLKTRSLSAETDPSRAYRPFDRQANGYVPGEGGAMFLVEELSHAQPRGAQIYAEILGHASTQDGYHHMHLAPDARQYARAMTLALRNSGVSPEEVDVIFADAAGTPEGDKQEVAALQEVFSARASKIPVTAPKSMTGRLYAGGASLDVAAAILAMRDGAIPPIANLAEPASNGNLDFVTGQERRVPVRTALVAARGYGGFNSALVLRKWTD